MSRGRLHLLPNLLSEDTVDSVIPQGVKDRLLSLKHFIVENEKVARRFLKKVDRSVEIDTLSITMLDKRNPTQDYRGMLAVTKDGHDIGLLSDAGCPAVADPGALVVEAAHEMGVGVVPHVGPSSILLTVMASGMNGQSFTFHGYVPRDKGPRSAAIKKMEENALRNGVTQLFMDTPYRNGQVIADLLSTCRPSTRLCIAIDITGTRESIRTKTIEEWKKVKLGDTKIPIMFALGR